MTKVYDRYCYLQFFAMLVVGTMIPAGICLYTQEFQSLMTYIKELGCPLDLLAIMTTLQLPEIIVRCLPGGVLLGTILVFYQFSHSFEIVALRTSGVSLARILQPFLVVGMCCACFSFFLNDFVVPQSAKLSSRLALVALAHRDLPNVTGVNTYVGFEYNSKGLADKIVVVASRVGRQLNNTVLLDFSNGKYIKMIWAPTGLYKGAGWHLFNGHIYEIFNKSKGYNNLRFEKIIISPPKQDQFDPMKREALPSEMSAGTLRAKIKKMQDSGEKVPANTWFRYYRRFSDPLSCVFVIIGAFPIIISGRRRISFAGLLYGGLVILAYFFGFDIIAGFVEHDRMNPLLAAWLPGVSIACLGGVLMFIAGLLRK